PETRSRNGGSSANSAGSRAIWRRWSACCSTILTDESLLALKGGWSSSARAGRPRDPRPRRRKSGSTACSPPKVTSGRWPTACASETRKKDAEVHQAHGCRRSLSAAECGYRHDHPEAVPEDDQAH